MQVTTELSPEAAVAQMVPLLTNGGATVNSATPSALTGEVVTRKGPDAFIAIVLLLLLLIPGVLYILFGSKTIAEPFSITLVPGPGGTTLTAAGQGRGQKAAEYAVTSLVTTKGPSPGEG